MTEVDLPFNAWLKRQRRSRDLTRDELAREIGCALSTLQKIESGERRPSKQIAERLAEVLGVPLAERAAFVAYARAQDLDAPSVAPPTAPAAPWQATASPIRRHNLPRQLTNFVGREREMSEVEQLLAKTCLLTLAGAGGSGKTRLALQVAERLVDDYSDGVWWVDLARLSDAALLPQAVAAGLGLRPKAERPLLDQMADYLQRRHLLLVLDNCEHLIGPCASFADAFLRIAPRLTILATSREPLGIDGESIYRVPTLQVPEPDHLLQMAALAEVESVRLFRDRAKAAQVGFGLSSANAAQVAEICRRLDGMPLGIELAAARVKEMPVAELCARLDDRFRLLTGGSRAALPRHQTLRATLDWSYGLLSDTERVLFRRLAVFAGGWDMEAAEVVCGGPGLEGGVLEALAGLVDKSLVVLDWPDQGGRYRMLETMRQYALERLVESGDESSIRQAHANYFLGLAERAEPKLFGPEQLVWLAVLDTENSNQRLALEYAHAQADVETGLRLAGALWRFWLVRGHLVEGHAWLSQMLALAGQTARDESEPSRVLLQAKALLGAAACSYHQRDHRPPAPYLAESLRLYRAMGDRQGIARALFFQGWFAAERGALEEARPLFEESETLSREIGDRQCLGWALGGKGIVASWAGDSAVARTLLEQALALGREVNDELETIWWIQGLAFTLWDLKEYRQVQELAEESVQLCRKIGDREDLCVSALLQGMAALGSADEKISAEKAGPHLKDALELAYELGDRFMLSTVLATYATLSVVLLRPAQGLRLASAAAALAEAGGYILPERTRVGLLEAMGTARRALGPAAADTAMSQGRTMPLQQVIAEALGEDGA